ncbi:MAG TPA: TIR domain-containing protein [Rhizomicrobium sp.]|nr:TIR domain-containing protein [Rhizomicrobium sp.]
MADIFISYAREDREWVERLAKALQGDGFSVWWDWDLLVGKRYREAIETELSSAKVALVVWSQYSIHSDFVRDEAEEGQQRNILVPVLKEAVRPPAGFRQLQTADLATWTGAQDHVEFQRMLKGVSHLVGRPPSGGPMADPPPLKTDSVVAPSPPTDPGAPRSADSTNAGQGSASSAPASPVANPATMSTTLANPGHAGAAIPAGLANLAGAKSTSSTNPVWRYAAIGAVALVAVLYVIGTLFSNGSKPPPHGGGQTVHTGGTIGGQGSSGGNARNGSGAGSGGNTGGTGSASGGANANGDVAGNPHGSTSTTSRGSNGGAEGGQVTTPSAPASGSDSGGDVGQTGPHHGH